MTQAEVRSYFIKYNRGIKAPDGSYWYRCAICGGWCARPGRSRVRIPEYQKMEVDHIIPWSQGGSDELHNLQAVCKRCNRSKSNHAIVADTDNKVKNTIFHPIDTLVKTPLRKSLRQNKLLKGLGITKRR